MSMYRASSVFALVLWATMFTAACEEWADGSDVDSDASASAPDSGLAARDASAPGDGGRDPSGADAGRTVDAGANIPSTCMETEATSCSNQTGRHCGYTYEYWKDQGTGCLTNTPAGFRVDWNNINNLLGRKGLRPGSKTQVVTYSADYQPNGNSYLCVYGWTKSPLVEYYIVDSWGSWRPPGGDGHMGTVTTDDGTYDIYRTQRVNQPSIEGTATFSQYWSVRTQKRTNGTITVANHFDAWQRVGMNMGSLYEVSMCVEGYQSSGKADVSVSMK
jgi:endo-1,4-beta-xylanase